MKVLHISTRDGLAGGHIAAHRIHAGLRKIGVESTMLTLFKDTDDQDVFSPSIVYQNTVSYYRSLFDCLPPCFYRKKGNDKFTFSYLPINNYTKKTIKILNPDIINLHWVNNGFININFLKKINKPIVWTMHDMWPFTGGCHYNKKCEKYLDKCGQCPLLFSHSRFDLSRIEFNNKRKVYNRVNNINFVAPSIWLKNVARESVLLNSKKITNIPNAIDDSKFYPVQKDVARKILNMPLNKKIVLFGAINSLKDKRKGHDLLLQAIKQIDKNICLVIFGAAKATEDLSDKFETKYLGNVKDDITLKLIYSAADVMVVPSRQENLSCSIMESLACGTPVISFDIGGNGDMIKHKKNGYLAKPYDCNDLANGIEWTVSEQNNLILSKNSRKTVVENFNDEIVAQRYLDLYKSI